MLYFYFYSNLLLHQQRKESIKAFPSILKMIKKKKWNYTSNLQSHIGMQIFYFSLNIDSFGCVLKKKNERKKENVISQCLPVQVTTDPSLWAV